MWTPKNYIKNEDGNVAMMFAATVVMLIVGVGAAVDYSNMIRAQNELQAQVDSAVLAAATVELNHDESEAQKKQTRMDAANQVILVNGYEAGTYDPVLTVYDESVELSAKVDYNLFFGGFLGMETKQLGATAESGLPGATGVEIVLVLDNTNSMRVEGKLSALKTGAVSLVDAIEESGSESKIGLVPFARYVQVNESNRGESWLEIPAEYTTSRDSQQATHTGGTCTEVDDTRDVDGVMEDYTRTECVGQTTTYEPVTNELDSSWVGCVGTRVPPYSERDDAYSHPVPGLLNRYAKEQTGKSFDRKTYCPTEIVPLSDEYGDLRSALNGMYTTDETYLPTGLIWGQRVLSPGVPFDNSLSAGEEAKNKIMVLMTDGINTTEIQQDTAAEDELKAPPFIGAISDDDVAFNANSATLRMCENVKDEGVEIYTIAFKVTDPTTKNLLINCASDPSNALTADSNAALVQEFKRISSSITEDVRLMR